MAVARAVRFVRSEEPFAVADNVGWGYLVAREAFPVAERVDKCLLVDLRRAPLRTDPRFTKLVADELPSLCFGWRKVASLLQTIEGARQLKDLRARVGTSGRTFPDEDAALAWLLAR